MIMEKEKIIRIILAVLIILTPAIVTGAITGFPEYWGQPYNAVLIAGRILCMSFGLYLIYRVFEKNHRIVKR